MKKEINYAGITIAVLALSVLVMSIGYALQSQLLTINGNTTIGETAKWDVHFENLIVSNGSVGGEFVYTPANIVSTSGTYVVYDVKLPEKGDYYEFTLDVVNDGNIDAEVSSIILLGSDNYKDYVDYTVTYTDSEDGVYGNDSLLKGERRNIKVRVENIYEKNVLELGDLTFNLSFAIQYVQK